MENLFAGILLALVAGSIAYCVIAIVSIALYRSVDSVRSRETPPVSVLRALSGAEDNTEANLRSLFEQNYPDFEVLLAVHRESDPAAQIARRVMEEFPYIPARLVISGEPLLPNAKVWSLAALMREASREIIIITDSDVHLPAGCFHTLIAELSQPGIALVSCPYRAVGCRWPSHLHALGLNTDFIAGVLTARVITDCDFAIGCALATRRSHLNAIGGLDNLAHYLAEDFAMGNLMARCGGRVVLSRAIVDHYIGGSTFASAWNHRLRWARSTRRSRRAGYFGEIFTKPLVLAAALWAFWPAAAQVAALAVIARIALAWTAAAVFSSPAASAGYWLLLPAEDFLSFAAWLAGFFGDTIDWRGRRLTLTPDGSFPDFTQGESEAEGLQVSAARNAAGE